MMAARLDSSSIGAQSVSSDSASAYHVLRLTAELDFDVFGLALHDGVARNKRSH
jgi:hypothetical protein